MGTVGRSQRGATLRSSRRTAQSDRGYRGGAFIRIEKQRLAGEGYPGLAMRVRWVAKESAAYGFDILSFCGSSRSPGFPERRFAIEVKGQTVTPQNQFTFFLTSHEWRTALALGDQYAF